METKRFIKSGHVCLSGGAVGSDLLWGQYAAMFGHEVVHFSFKGHQTSAPSSTVWELTEKQLLKADEAAKQANVSLKRAFPAKSEFVSNLVRRNWYQINKAQAVFAIANINRNGGINGGTAWAISMFMDRHEDKDNCNIYIYAPNLNAWVTWRGGMWVVDYLMDRAKVLRNEGNDEPFIYAGIGSRKVPKYIKNVIEGLYCDAFGPYVEEAAQELT